MMTCALHHLNSDEFTLPAVSEPYIGNMVKIDNIGSVLCVCVESTISCFVTP